MTTSTSPVTTGTVDGREASPSQPIARVALVALLACAGTYLGTQVAVHWRLPEFGAAVLFPPYAILTAILVSSPPRQWWLYLLASTVGHLAATWPAWPGGWVVVVGVASLVRAVVAATGLRYLWPRGWRFDSLEGVAGFLSIAVLIAPASAALFVATVELALTGTGVSLPDWRAWFLANALTGLTLLPLIMIVVADPLAWRRHLSGRRVLEATALAVALVVVGAATLTGATGSPSTLPAQIYAPLPLLLWAAVRFGVGGASAAFLTITAVTTWGVMTGRGPLIGGSMTDSMFSLYLFLAFAAIPLMLLAALIKERERTVTALGVSQHRYRLATNAAGVGVWDWDLVTNEMYLDPGLKAALGYADHEIRNHMHDWARYVHPEDSAAVGAKVTAHLEGKTEAFEIEHRMLHRDGGIRWFLARGAAVRDATGKPLRLVGTDTDVTDIKRAEESVREVEERVALAVACAKLGFMALDVWNGDIWASDECRRIWGLPPDASVTVTSLGELMLPEDRARTHEAFITSILHGSRYEVEYRIRMPNGEMRWVGALGHLKYDSAGVPVRLAGVVIDITERKRAELEIQENRGQLAHLARVTTLGELSAALAHELNQPLTAIKTNAQTARRLLERDPPVLTELTEIIEDIVRDDSRAGDVIWRIRELLRKGETRFEAVDLGQLTEDVLVIAQGDLATRGVSASAQLANGPVFVRGDKVQLQQVVLNLLLNASDSMSGRPAGSRRITISIGLEPPDNGLISVVDGGTGIPEDEMERVFEPFVTSKQGGLGLGLAICRSIVKRHRGRLWAVNNPSGGATFHLALPLGIAPATDP